MARTTMLDSSRRSRSISARRLTDRPSVEAIQQLTLLAGFAFNLANMFCDCVFVASAMVTAARNVDAQRVVGNKGDSVGTTSLGARPESGSLLRWHQLSARDSA
jgi:hypothetical protein